MEMLYAPLSFLFDGDQTNKTIRPLGQVQFPLVLPNLVPGQFRFGLQKPCDAIQTLFDNHLLDELPW